MKAIDLYNKLEKDFIISGMSDNWALYMNEISEFICDNFKNRSMGVVCDFTKNINKVYSAVFPSSKVMQKILDEQATEALLFVHHPSIWNIKKAPEVFEQMDTELLRQFKERKIAIYNLHVPLDNFRSYSTSVSLAKMFNLQSIKPFAKYFGGLAGVFGRVNLNEVVDLKNEFSEIVGHEVGLYDYGDDIIINQMVAIVAGGGLDSDVLEEMHQSNVRVLITGVTAKNDFSKNAHALARKYKINVLGGTHYSTEKFACIAMVDYFKKMNLLSEFIPEEPMLEDL